MKEAPGKTIEWYTPDPLVKRLEAIFGRFTLDPCATPESARAPKFFTKEDDGLIQSWTGENCWLNPPYGDEIPAWVDKAARESRNANTSVVALLPARTDTDWFHYHVLPFIDTKLDMHGRVHFIGENGKEAKAPQFPSIIVRFSAMSVYGIRYGTIEAEDPPRRTRRKGRNKC